VKLSEEPILRGAYKEQKDRRQLTEKYVQPQALLEDYEPLQTHLTLNNTSEDLTMSITQPQLPITHPGLGLTLALL
jgi:hypothetical protein